MAEFVAEVEVISTECGAVMEDDFAIVTNYESTMRTIEMVKGELPAEFTYVSRRTEFKGGDEPGCSEAEYPLGEGWTGRAYLKTSGPGYYTVQDWGGIVDDASSQAAPLPLCNAADPDPVDPDPSDPTDPGTDPAPEATTAAGCAVGSGHAGAGLWLAALALGLGLARRRC
jgi:MYXO-CTERM domain-containing protein